MNFPPKRLLSFFILSTLLLCSTPLAFASDDGDAREVRIASVQGDVRLSRGDGKHTHLNKTWEQAQAGELLEQGFALATGNGRAEIEFENGSTAFLAENSLLLFRELSAPADRLVTRMTLPTGRATFSLQPAPSESFFVETPTDKIEVTAPDFFFTRLDAYLDATGLTPQGEKGEAMVRKGLPKLSIPKGRTLFFQQGQIIERLDPAQTVPHREQYLGLVFTPSDLQAILSAMTASGLAPLISGGPVLQSAPSHTAREQLAPATNSSPAASDWDSWVASRFHERAAITAAALKASGLSSPIPGLNNLYTHGTFFPCEPYGTCWEPSPQQALGLDAPRSQLPNAQSQFPSTSTGPFQSQTVEWLETSWGLCGSRASRRISRIAHTQQELEELLRLKDLAERQALQGASYSTSCQDGFWIHHHNHFVRVLTLRTPPGCTGKGCRPVHPPHPFWVKAGGKVGLVPRHPNDVKGKPPINLKNGILIPPSKPGEPLQHVALDSSQKVKILDKAPKEFQSGFVARAVPVSHPEISGYLMQDFLRGKTAMAANHADSHIVFNYKSQKFMMPAASGAGAKAREVPVGGIASNGKVASFADGHSGRYAESFARSGVAGSYGGGARFSGSYSSGSSYSGGGRSSGSYSSSSGSSGGSSSHYSGGSSASSSSSGSSASSSSTSSGRSH